MRWTCASMCSIRRPSRYYKEKINDLCLIFIFAIISATTMPYHINAYCDATAAAAARSGLNVIHIL